MGSQLEMRQQIITDESKAINDLKVQVRGLVQQGVAYKSILAFCPAGSDENALRQFVHRDSIKPRMTPLARSMLDSFEDISRLIVKNSETEGTGVARHSALEFKNVSQKMASERINDKFDNIRQISFQYMAKNYILRRKKLDNSLIALKIEIIQGNKKKYSFVMKINGSHKKRLVFGNVSDTLKNLYFQGLAYQVAGDIDQSTFNELDYFNETQINKYVSHNPIGIETISFPRSDLEAVDFPVFYLGLDGAGAPIMGRGLMLNCDHFDMLEKFYLNSEVSIANHINNTYLKKRIEEFDFQTTSWQYK
jgi:hypothetical protein